MARNMGMKPPAPDQVHAVMSAAVDAVCERLPRERRDVVERVVYDVTAELVSTVTDPGRLAAMVRLRATARLSAATGELTPIRSTPRVPEPRSGVRRV